MATLIRPETLEDRQAIRDVTQHAFAGRSYSSGKESQIVDALRDAGQLITSFVAVLEDQVVGHIAVSPIQINGKHGDWFALGPVSVCPEHQQQGIGSALVETALSELKGQGADGCVELGNASFYARFGFERHSGLVYKHAPMEDLQRIIITGPPASGIVSFDEAFNI